MQYKGKLHQSNITQQGRSSFLIAVLLCFSWEAFEQSCTHLWLEAAKLKDEQK